MNNDGKSRVFARSLARDLTAEEIEQVSGGWDRGLLCNDAQGQSYTNTFTGASVEPMPYDPGQLDDQPVVDNDNSW